MVRRIVSFCVYGSHPRYLLGALKNAADLPAHYPGWEGRFYCATSTDPSILSGLKGLGASVVMMPDPDPARAPDAGMFWRFLPAEEGLDACIFRDTDSRLSDREARAVDAWIISGRRAHIMRDHPDHRVPILGGMWGVRGSLTGLRAAIAEYVAGRSVGRGEDQRFLETWVYPRVAVDALAHDEVVWPTSSIPFPVPRRGSEFVGLRYDELDRPFPGDLASMQRYLTSVSWRRPAGLLGLPGEPR